MAMRNLALQAEVRHVLPARKDKGRGLSSKIIAVIQNTDTYLQISHPNGFDYNSLQGNDDDGVGGEMQQPNITHPPSSFVVTSEGMVYALDVTDQLIWVVDLEKVVADSIDDDDDNVNDNTQRSDATMMGNESNLSQSQWFYAAGFFKDGSPDESNDGILGMNVASGVGLHITCLSHAGYVVSVSIDETNSLSSKGDKNIEEGSECIGIFENGLECGGWSPDGEVLALVTFASDADEEGNSILVFKDTEAKVPILMTMNTQYEILSEVRMDPCLFSAHECYGYLQPNDISLCWRPDSSSLAVSTMDANFTNTPIRRIRTYHRSTLQILSLSKEEDGSGRDVPNLFSVEPTWAPAGCSHYVGAVQSSRSLTIKSSANRHVPIQVAFMEPNGLRHRECKIHNTTPAKTDKEDVIGIAFNLEGDLLAVASTVTRNDAASDQPYGKLQLYSRSNFHWYLKYELRFDGYYTTPSSVLSKIMFSETDPYQITVALARHQGSVLEWREYTFRWESSTIQYRHNQQSATSSSVLAMVIDGKTLNFTPLDKSIIPPPMYAASLELPAPVVGIASKPCFRNDVTMDGRIDFVVALSDGKLALLRSGYRNEDKVTLTPGFCPPSFLGITDPQKFNSLHETTDSGLTLNGTILRDITVIDAHENALTLIASSCSPITDANHQFLDQLIEMSVSFAPQANTSDLLVTASVPLVGRALRFVNWSDTAYSAGARGSALIELTDGSLLEYSRGGLMEPCSEGPLLEACPWVAGVYDARHFVEPSIVSEDDSLPELDASSKRIVVGLSNRGRLYSGERLLSSASSSFVISLQHMFLTHVTISSQPQMRFLPLSSLCDFDSLMESDNQNVALNGYEPRSIERGAQVVAMFPTNPIVVIQLPRGNLESISPRACLLPFIMKRIQNGDFLQAFDIMRRQRVDLNLLVDFDPTGFLTWGAEQFVDQIEKIENINLFLSSLVDVDTTLWKYPVPSWIRAETGAIATSNRTEDKINAVCKKMRQVMLDAEKEGRTWSGRCTEKDHFLLPIITTLAKESPPKLEEALSLIVSSRSSNQRTQKSGLLSERVQSSIQYLAFLADYELIFNTAIGMYNFDLAKAVARHSQMDPKVYLPMLKRWREMSEPSARFEVDVKLKRYESALRHLVASGSVGNNTPDESFFTRCLKFIEEHSLHDLGLDLFRDDIGNHRCVMISLGERLMTERKFKDALTIFLASTPKYLDGAKRASRACDDWRTYFACCSEDGETIGSDHATSIAESISSNVGNMHEQRENYACAAIILLDYAEDVSYAIDMLISAHLWTEGRRVAYLHKRVDLVKKVVDACVTYARTCVQDLIERTSSFETDNHRYEEVIVIRREAIRDSGMQEGEDIHDDSASIFSMQSTSSNLSVRSSSSRSSMGSVGSVGSAASVSTVISVGAKSTFSFIGDVDNMKHKSKFNKIGRDKKKKKKSQKKIGSAAGRTKQGSEEELKELVSSLEHSCPDGHYVDVISETITFLVQSGKQSMSKLLFETYKELELAVLQAQTARLDKNTKLEEDYEQRKRKKEGHMDFIRHRCESHVNNIFCKPLPESVQGIFPFLI